jgi:N-acetylglucosaminyl-diphospho-decaprenol L-rhamnosyltransferase
MSPDIDVVIVTYNSAHVIGGLLNSLPVAMGGLTYDTVIVDNGSSDDTVEILAARPDCRVVRSMNTGYAGGINRGVHAASHAPAILILNPDVRLGEKSVPSLLAVLGDGAGIAVPQVRTAAGSLDLSLRREPTVLRGIGLNWTGLPLFAEYLTRPSEYAEPRVVDWALGAVMLVSRKCYDVLGGWDESFFLYSEETDFCLRARDAGLLTRYEPGAVAVHIGGQSGRSRATHAMQIINRIRLYRRRHRRLASWCYFGVNVMSEFSWVLRGNRHSWYAITALFAPSRRPPELEHVPFASNGRTPRVESPS